MKNPLKKIVHQFPVIIHEDELGGYWVECPTLRGCYSQGETVDEALDNIREAISLSLEDIPQKKKEETFQGNIGLHFVTV